MPTKRVPITRRPVELTEVEWRWLTDEPEPSSEEDGNAFARMMLEGPQRDEDRTGKAREIWEAHRDEVLALWVREWPGTRPSNWWRFDAPRQPLGTWPGWWLDGKLPEPRLRLGGTGTPAHECMNYVPDYDHGIPTIWITAEHYETKRQLGNGSYPCQREATFVREHRELSAPAFDPNDPPIYESEAAYLERHGLLLPGERRRLTAADFEPVAVAVPADD